jgi:hypothetical protein
MSKSLEFFTRLILAHKTAEIYPVIKEAMKNLRDPTNDIFQEQNKQ